MSLVLPSLLQQIDKVVSFPSVSSANKNLDMSNKSVIDYLANTFEDMGFNCEVIPCDSEDKKFNLIATLGAGPGGLVLAGHTDTVPFDEGLWSVDPFQLTEKDGKIYGLGITDMKGFFPIVMEAIKEVINHQFKEPLIILATADEESSMLGAKTLAELGKPKARSALIGEPTGMRPVKAHKGIMMDSIRLVGQSGHSSDRHWVRMRWMSCMKSLLSCLLIVSSSKINTLPIYLPFLIQHLTWGPYMVAIIPIEFVVTAISNSMCA